MFEREREACYVVSLCPSMKNSLRFALMILFRLSFYLLMLLFCFLSFSCCMQYHEKENDFESTFLFCGLYVHYIVFWNCLKLFSALFWFFGFMRPAYKIVDISYQLISICSQLCYFILSFETLVKALFCNFF